MTRWGPWGRAGASALAVIALVASSARGEVLTADRAVELALQHNLDVATAEAGVVEGRSGMYSAYSGLLPSLTGTYSRAGTRTDEESGIQQFGSVRFPFNYERREFYATTPEIGGSWNLLDLSAWTGLGSARAGLRAARFRREATRNDVALAARRQFYEVVKRIKLATVAEGALKLAQDDERRVRALFEVGSVSKSDLLKAQVRTAQSELERLTSNHQVTVQRISLGNLLGVEESQLGEVDTILTFTPRDYDEAQLQAEAARNRPDLRAADAELSAARSGLLSARLSRLPSVVGSGSVQFDPSTDFTNVTLDSANMEVESSGSDDRHRVWQGSLALEWKLGFATESRVATARARLIRAEETSASLRRSLSGEVRQALLSYREVVEGEVVARRALESAQENLKLSQEKYNVGSATILELIDAQVQLQRAQSDLVTAQASIRVAEAQVERVRGSVR